VKPILNSCTIIGKSGGIACNVKIKENLVIKPTKSALDFPALASFKRFHSYSRCGAKIIRYAYSLEVS